MKPAWRRPLLSPAVGLAQNHLIATVGTNDSQVITLTQENGAPVNDIPAGTYTITVRDRSSQHNFHLTGPGVDRGRYVIIVRDRSTSHNFHLYGLGVSKRTRVANVGRTRWRVLFRRGLYRYRCDPHALRMRGSFRVV